MRKRNIVVAFVLSFGLAQVALAAGGEHAGGMSGEHMSASGQTNNNAQSAPDATRGLDRAQERTSEQGAAHEHATAHEAQHGKTKTVAKRAKQAETTDDAK